MMSFLHDVICACCYEGVAWLGEVLTTVASKLSDLLVLRNHNTFADAALNYRVPLVQLEDELSSIENS